jgi:hypothetical protein
MANFKLLRDLYQFPGFVPFSQVRGLFGDPMAVVITLRRRRKKRSAAPAGRPIEVITTNGLGKYAIFPVETNGSISTFLCDAYAVPSVAA